jgi:pimeloyl-ACP methyl ester carboxylesterase
MAWKNAYNELAHDPQLAGRFQFWLYFYSTGNPILLSAARLRGHLQDARNQFDPDGRDPAMDHIMLVGHSMGGLLTRSAISHSGDQMWQALAKISFDQLQLPDDEKQKMEKAFFFEPVPGVKRAVFMATPHKGSPLGDAWYGRLGSSLVNVPDSVQQMSKDLVKYNGRDVFDPSFIKGRQSSIAQLRWENPVLKALHELPVSQSVTYHSIVGLQPGDHPDTGGDGVVPYKSAHIEGAMTELVVPSHHSVQETPAAIVELKRILDEHWSVYKTDMAAMKKNQADATKLAEAKPQLKTRPDGPTPVRFAEPVKHASATASTPAPNSAIQLATEAALESLRR